VIYDLGDGVNLRHEVRDASGQLVAATVTLVVTKPDGSTTNPAVTTPSVGIYDAATFTADQVDAGGLGWIYRWNVSGAVTDVAHGSFSVADPAPATYVSLPLVKAALGKLSDDDRDELIVQAIRSACRLIDRRTGRRFYADRIPTARVFPVTGRTFWDTAGGYGLLVDDVAALGGLVVETGGGDTWTALTGYETEPHNAIAQGRPVTVIRTGTVSLATFGAAHVRVTARWGWPAVPDEIVEAALLLSTRFYRRKDSPQGVMGNAEFGLARVSRVDPDVEALVSHLILPGFA
jgi:hypothetical protein